ncbi:pectin acetylesterase-family hydrolase [Archangium sp.]|uniref:pectin acetylesterase-family hydrolase n=1 Tax=Archangium sp. TaxID=1872627 RepID=UPI00389AA10A
MRRILALSLLLLPLAATPIAGCGNGSPDPTPPATSGPIDTPKNTWTWVDFPDSACDDGSPTGIAVNKGDSKNLLVFLNGGGACWDFSTCFQLNTASHGPFGKAQFQVLSRQLSGTILNRALPNNPFADWNLVFVPYCTGDVHAGDNVIDYKDSSSGASRTYHHVGRANLAAYLQRLGVTFSPEKLVVSGSSAGGFGAAFDHDLFRATFPNAQGYLVDDSGPPLKGDAISSSLREAWYQSWRLDKALEPTCPECRDDLSQAMKHLAQRFPQDRIALLSSTQDSVIRSYFSLSADSFQTALNTTLTDVLEPQPNFRAYVVEGQFHTFLGSPDAHPAQGVKLTDWLGQMVRDDASWQSLEP